MPDENLTGAQIEVILDKLLYSALEPIILHTNLFDVQVINMFSQNIVNRKRKISAMDREDIAVELIDYIMCGTDRVHRVEIVKRLRPERNIVHAFLSKVVGTIWAAYEPIYSRLITDSACRADSAKRLDTYVRSVGAESRSSMFHALVVCSSFLADYDKFFSSVVSQYVKMCSMQARAHMKKHHSRTFDFDDLRQSFLRSVVVAINKYDSSKGPLTSYIKWWIFNAATCGTDEHEYGIAFTVSSNQKKMMATSTSDLVNFAVSLDALVVDEDELSLHELLGGSTDELDDEIEKMTLHDIVRAVVKSVDPTGIGRLTLEVGEHFFIPEREKMREISKTVNAHC